MGLFKHTGEDPENKDPRNIQGAFRRLRPDPRRLDKDVPANRPHEAVWECGYGFEHNTQRDADRCNGDH